MIEKLGNRLTQIFLKYMPNAFVFALALTLLTVLIALIWLGSSPLNIVTSWYKGFFDLLDFAMQIVLIIITGFCIALSPIVRKAIDKLTLIIKSPGQVYVLVVFIGGILTLVSFGWIVITSVFARELAKRVKGINYPFLIACTYFSGNVWVMGFSSTIPLMLNTNNNFLMDAGVLGEIIPTNFTLQSSLNMAFLVIMLIGGPLVMFLLKPKSAEGKELDQLITSSDTSESLTIKEEAKSLKLPFPAWSDRLNNGSLIQLLVALMGIVYIIYHFYTNGFDLNFNIMIFIFLIIGLILHKTPMRYVLAMQRSSSNVSGILFQYPFYAGIMGIMLYTGLGERLGQVMASLATLDTYPFYAYLTGAMVNFAIPSAGGEFAVVGPSVIKAVTEMGAGLSEIEITKMISRASLSIAYGETITNMLQPFYLLLVMPVMGKGVKLQARDIMGYLILPFVIFFIIQSLLLIYWPM
ncbi:TIGR00366 family protein [Aegicerativicinus sediminis]